jgi:S-(hydroxymethyl)glutathione dehydrogenase / alcohol dehydrogenase
MLMRAAVYRSLGAPLEIEQVAIRHPKPEEVLVRIAACAICHSDVAYIDGEWSSPLPIVYGHEAAGVVTELGAAETEGLRVGDHVVVTLIRSCGQCLRCASGRPALCEGVPDPGNDPVLTGADGEIIHQAMRTGAFAEFVTVHQSQVAVVPPTLPLEAACLLGCGVLTGVGAVRNTAGVEPGSTVLVLGAGGVGLNCIQGAALAGAAEIIAADLVAAKLSAAREFGATRIIDAAAFDLAAAVRELTGGRGADYVFVAASVASLVELGCSLLRRGGTVVAAGIPPTGATVTLDPVAIADGSLRILGSKLGDSCPRTDIPRLAELYSAGKLKLDELIGGRYELDQINDAIAGARAGDQLRLVLTCAG